VKVLKSIEDKEKRAAMAKNTTALVESKKRKGGGATKTISKKQKGGAVSKVASISSAGEETGGSCANVVASPMEAVAKGTEVSAASGDVDLMACITAGFAGGAALNVESLPSIFGPGSSLSSSDDQGAGADAMAASDEDKASSRGQA